MVNTRRKDSLSSHDVEPPRYHTRRSYNDNEESGQGGESFYENITQIADCPSEVKGGEEQRDAVEDSDRSHEFKNHTVDLENTNRVRELRSRFVSDRKFSTSTSYSRRHEHKSRASNRKASVDKSTSLMVFKSTSKMLNNESDAYSPPLRNHRNRHDHHKQHRRALSLRPITRKSYNDKCYIMDSDPEEEEEEDMSVRRSSRITGNRRNYNMSWLVDEQMHKVGYPNLGADYYDEDSLEAQIAGGAASTYALDGDRYCHRSIDMANTASTDNLTDATAKDTDEYIPPSHIVANGSAQHRLRLRAAAAAATATTAAAADVSPRDKENIHEAEEEEICGAAKMTRQKGKLSCAILDDDDDGVLEHPSLAHLDNVRDDENTVAARIGPRTRGTYVRSRLHAQHSDGGEKPFAHKSTAARDVKPQSSHDDPAVQNTNNEQEKKLEKSGESDYEIRHTTKNLRRRAIVQNNVQNRRNRKLSESSSSSEVSRKRYSLRNRSKKNFKMSPLIISSNRHSKRRFNLRRRKPMPQRLSSSSSSDSDNDDYRTPKKYINAKALYTKSEHKTNLSKSKFIRPEQMDGSVRFSSVGGLDSHVQCLKEMILLPMMYPGVFNRFQIQPPRGILFHGPPGTGKTLIARALANECSFGSRKLSFFMRKGADLLCKWVGESEKQLRLLFDQACELKPSIIFFDELDGLAPVRSARNDQFHASIVSTLLALMDGLNNRGEVIVIGATNRIDAIDPALRRPGRFDRELYFPLPARKEREEILRVHVSKWECPPTEHLLSYLAESAVGYCGSDLRALCSEAVIQSFRRVYPQVYSADHILLLNPENVKVERIDFLRAKSMLVPAAHRIVQNFGRKLLPILVPLLEGPLNDILAILGTSFPHGINPALAKVKLSAGYKAAQLLLSGDGRDHGQTSYLAPALLQRMEHIHTHSLDLTALYRQSGIAPEEACIQVFHEAKRNVPSMIYIPCVNSFWELASRAVQAIFLSQIASMDSNLPILILATSDVAYSDLEPQLQTVFSHYRYELYHLTNTTRTARASFFRPLIAEVSVRAVRHSRTVRTLTPPPLPRARTPPPPPLSPDTSQRVFEAEDRTLRELRIFLREICKKLATNRLFFIFTKPVDIKEVPDYPTIIKEPMDLETMMTKVDLHSYQCAKDFLADIELICQNALEYNPAKTSTDKQIRHRACSLRDYAFTLIRDEMDSDFEDKCQDIRKKRAERKASVAQYLCPYLHTAPSNILAKESTEIQATAEKIEIVRENVATVSAIATIDSANTTATNQSFVLTPRITPSSGSSRRKRRIPNWQRGYVTSSKRRRQQRSQRPLPSLNAVTEHKEQSSMGGDVKNVPDGVQVTKLNCVINDETTIFDGDVKEHDMNSSHMQQLIIDTSVTDVSAAAASLADLPGLSAKSSTCKRRLSDLLSPSELLNDHLEFDDIDQTLNETAISSSQVTIEVSRNALEDVLEKVLDATAEQPLQVLLDIYYQLSRIIKMYSATNNRKQLPQDLLKELARFTAEKERRNCILNESEFIV